MWFCKAVTPGGGHRWQIRSGNPAGAGFPWRRETGVAPGIVVIIVKCILRSGFHRSGRLQRRNAGGCARHFHHNERHLLFPAGAVLEDAHRIATEIERVIEGSLKPRANLTAHLESASDRDVLHPDEEADRP